MKKSLFLLLTAYLICCASAYGGSAVSAPAYTSSVVVLANSIDDPLAGGLYDFLNTNGFEIIKVNATDFPSYENSPLILILGGQNAAEGVGAFSAEVLSQTDEENLISSDASKGVFNKTDAWASGQQVFVFAGYDEIQTQAAWMDGKQAVIENAASNDGLLIKISSVSGCGSAKFNEILFNVTLLNASQKTWSTNTPDDYISLYCNGTEAKNFKLFERKIGIESYGRNDLMHKSLEGEYRLKVACSRDISNWIDDISRCSEVRVGVALPHDSGYGIFNPGNPKPSVQVATPQPSVSIASPADGDNVSVWSNGVGFIVNITNNGTEDEKNIRLNAVTASGKVLETNYDAFNVPAGGTQEVLVRVTASQVPENDTIRIWLDGGRNVTLKVDRHVNESVPLYCSFCARKH